MNPRLKVMMVAAEMAPFAKTGGLGDVIGALPNYIAELGHDVTIFIPHYGQIKPDDFGATREIDRLLVPMKCGYELGTLYSIRLDNMRLFLVSNERYFERDELYGYCDDGERFVFACRGALTAVQAMDWPPDVIHCHDWHTGLIPNWLKTIYRDNPFFTTTRSLFTIHNLAYQGIFGRHLLQTAGLSEQGLIRSHRYPERSHVIDFMARGIIFADKINTVSEQYAREILTPQYGEQLEEFLQDREGDLSGIQNGIDTVIYNPATDPNLIANFDTTSWHRKIENKLALQQETGLELDPEKPLAAVVTRLSHQKGLDLLSEIIPTLTRLGGQLLVLGVGDVEVEKNLVLAEHISEGSVRIILRFDPGLAQRVYAGADTFLLPSRFEPCGLTQMIAMLYGTVPIGRSTGGLKDTIIDFSIDPDRATGFSFVEFNVRDFMGAISRAFELYRNRTTWRSLALRCMKQDFSWPTAARRYAELYNQLASEPRAARR